MRLVVDACLTVAILALAAPAAAQVAPEAPSDEIVVNGMRNRDRSRNARDFVNEITAARGPEQLSRFEEAVCPMAVGLSPEQNAAVATRLRRVAEAVGLKAGGAACHPNMLVAVVFGKQQFIEGLARKQPSLFATMAPGEVRRLARDPAPVAAWQHIGWTSANGIELFRDSSVDFYINATAGSSPLTMPTAHAHFRAAVVVVEAEAGAGLTTTQLADYAAMRAFARTDPSRLPASVPSILKAVGAPPGTAVPITLTQWDLAFLRGLYSSSDDATLNGRRAEVRRTVERATAPAGKGAKNED